MSAQTVLMAPTPLKPPPGRDPNSAKLFHELLAQFFCLPHFGIHSSKCFFLRVASPVFISVQMSDTLACSFPRRLTLRTPSKFQISSILRVASAGRFFVAALGCVSWTGRAGWDTLLKQATSSHPKILLHCAPGEFAIASHLVLLHDFDPALLNCTMNTMHSAQTGQPSRSSWPGCFGLGFKQQVFQSLLSSATFRRSSARNSCNFAFGCVTASAAYSACSASFACCACSALL